MGILLLVLLFFTEVFTQNIPQSDESLVKNLKERSSSFYQDHGSYRNVEYNSRAIQPERSLQYPNGILPSSLYPYQQSPYNHQVNQLPRYQPTPVIPRYRYDYLRPSPEPTRNHQTSQVQQVKVQNINQNHYHQPSGYYPQNYGYRFGLPLVIPIGLHTHFGGYGYGNGQSINNINNVQQIHENICTNCNEINTYNEGDHYGSRNRPSYSDSPRAYTDTSVDQSAVEAIPEKIQDQETSNNEGETASYGGDSESFGESYFGDDGGSSGYDGGSSGYDGGSNDY